MKIIANLSGIVTLLVFLCSFIGSKTGLTKLQYSCLGISLFALIALIAWELYHLPKTYKNDAEINKYMLKWIKITGRTLIFTRDMSWATDHDIKEVLKVKAKIGDLILCMPKKNDLARELELIGAEIVEYSKLKYCPKSRFTMIHYGKVDTKMAIGRKDNKGMHHIEEVSSGVHTEYHLAEDLFEILKEIKYNE